MGGGGCPTFWFFKSLDNNMVYTLGIYIYTCIHIVIISVQIPYGFDI